VEENITE
jgi:hypothetical protein